MKRRRVKITGIGPVTPAGTGCDEFWRGVQECVSRIRPYTRLGDEAGPLVAACVDRFSALRFFERNQIPKGISRQSQFAMVGAKLAIEDAGLSTDDITKKNVIIVSGSSLMDFGGISDSTESVFKKGPHAALPRTIFTTTNANTTESIARIYGIAPRTMTLQNSCCAGLDAIGYAAAAVENGEAEIAICGGTEAPLHRCPVLELRAAGLTPATIEMSDRLARPFDLWRTTGVVSEGACMLILEPEESPREGYCFVAGYGYANDTGKRICGGLSRSARLAMASACIGVERVDSISAWAPGHISIDHGEACAMGDVFGNLLTQVPAYSIKGAIGSALGAAPAIQVAAAALSISFGVIPPTVNWSRPDPGCPLNISAQRRFIESRIALVNAHGVGGVNSCMVLAKC